MIPSPISALYDAARHRKVSTMHPSPESTESRAVAHCLDWSSVLRALREARGITQAGWAAQLGVSRMTVLRWERGERAPDPAAEAAIMRYCREQGLFRTYQRGPLAGYTLSAELIQDLLAGARWRAAAGCPSVDRSRRVRTRRAAN